MKPAIKPYVVLCLIVLVAVACGPVTAVPTATKIIIPTNTIAPTNASFPEPSATATLSQVERIFTLPTRPSELANTPTPIATPALDISAMRLRALSEEDAFHLTNEMNEYSYQYFPSFRDWWTDSQFIGSQELVALAIQEYLYRFPESPNAHRLRWQLAFINSIVYDSWEGNLAGNQYGDEWMLGELQEGLNRGEASPDQLQTILGKYWFNFAYIQPFENLFADGKSGWLYQVIPQVWEEMEVTQNYSVPQGSIFFAVRDNGENKFEIHLLNSAWNFSFGDSYVFDVTDHNQNGNPEITLYIGAHSGSMCTGHLLIYEWNGEEFAELTKNNLLLNDCVVEGFQYFEIGDAPAITFSGLFPSRKEQYIWNGRFYDFSHYVGATPLEIWRNTILSSRFSYADEIELLNQILASGEAINLGPAYPDYLRYRLGIAYAFQSKRDKAMQELEDLVLSPSDRSRDLFPAMAHTFMENYTDASSVYNACRQSNEIYENALKSYYAANPGANTEGFQNAIGFSSEGFGYLYSIPFCDEEDAFSLVVSSVSTSVISLEAEFRELKVNVNRVEKIDVKPEGKIKWWFVAFDMNSLFLIFPNGSHYQAKELSNGYIGDSITADSFLEVSIETWDKFANPLMMIQSNRDFILLELEEDDESNPLISEFAVMNYMISGRENDPQVQIFYVKPSPESDYPDSPWIGYRWNFQEHRFTNDLLEYNLFILHNPEKSVELVEKILPLLEEWKDLPRHSTWSALPYIYYLAGLSYELSGDNEKAAQMYWQLWHGFPWSPYALMAQYKLEPVSP